MDTLFNIILKCKKKIIEDGKKDKTFYDPNTKILENITSDYCQTQEEARQNLLSKVSRYKFVKIIDDKKGVKWVEVDTGWKTYTYTIHAHSGYITIGKEMANDLFGNKYEADVYKPVIYADLKFHYSCFKNDKEFSKELEQFEEYRTAKKIFLENLK